MSRSNQQFITESTIPVSFLYLKSNHDDIWCDKRSRESICNVRSHFCKPLHYCFTFKVCSVHVLQVTAREKLHCLMTMTSSQHGHKTVCSYSLTTMSKVEITKYLKMSLSRTFHISEKTSDCQYNYKELWPLRLKQQERPEQRYQ